MIERLTTIAVHQKAVNDITRTQSELLRLQQQITSGRKANSFAELGSEINTTLDLEASIKATDKFIGSNKAVLTRLKTMDVAVSQAEEIAAELAQQLVLEQGTSGATLNITEFARSALDRISDSLNTSIGGRFLFSGSKTNIAPIAENGLDTSNIINNQATTNYYQGDDTTFSVKATQQLDVEYGIKANDPAFRDLIGALNFAIRAEASGGTSNPTDLATAVDLVNQAVSGLANVRNKINTDIVTLNNVNDQHERVKLNLEEIFNETVATDIVGATIELQFNDAVLTATMQTFAQISRLSLADFLR